MPDQATKMSKKSVVNNHIEKPLKMIESNFSPMPRTRSEHAAANCKIFALNDDCLLEIFTYLPTIDLCAVKDTCRRFSALADYAAQLRFQQVAEFECVPTQDNQKDLAIFMQHFGKFIGGKIVVKSEPTFDAKKMWLLLKHCGALNELELIGVNVSGLPIHRMKKMLQNVNILQFKKCCGKDSDYARVINACVNLRSLTAFINLTGGSDMLLKYIAHDASNIEEIFFASINSNEATFVENMANLRHLKRLNLLFISCHNCSVAAAIDALAECDAPLYYIHLRDVLPDENLASALNKLNNLQLCFIQTAIEMPDAVRNSFGKFINDGQVFGLFNYKFSLKDQISRLK